MLLEPTSYYSHKEDAILWLVIYAYRIAWLPSRIQALLFSQPNPPVALLYFALRLLYLDFHDVPSLRLLGYTYAAI